MHSRTHRGKLAHTYRGQTLSHIQGTSSLSHTGGKLSLTHTGGKRARIHGIHIQGQASAHTGDKHTHIYKGLARAHIQGQASAHTHRNKHKNLT